MSADKIEATVIESSELSESSATKNALMKFDVNAMEVRAGVAKLNSLTVSDRDTREESYAVTVLANKAKILIEKKRVEIVTPYNNIVKAINLYAKESLVGPLQVAIDKADAKILLWDKEEANRKRAESESLEKERLKIVAEALAKELKIKADAEAEVLRLSIVAPKSRQDEINAMPHGFPRIAAQRELDAKTSGAIAAVQEKATASIQESQIDRSISLSDVRGKEEDLSKKTKGAMSVWAYELVDITKVHPDFLMVNPVAVNAAIKAGSRSIAGLKIYEDARLRH